MNKETPLIDKAFGLAQLSGNETLLVRMIKKFRDEFCNTPTEVISLIAQGNLKEAKMKVHTTKGISGNLGLSAVFESSRKLDQQLKQEAVEDSTIDDFVEVMRLTCEAIDTSFEEQIESTTISPETKTNDSKLALISKLEQHEFITDEELDDYMAKIGVAPQYLVELKTAIESLEYDKALTILTR